MSKRKKKKKTPQRQVKLKPHNYIRQRARKLPIHECINSSNWLERGMSDIFISRKRKNGNFILASYLVDTFCLGLKDTFYRFDLDPWEYEEIMNDIKSNIDSIPIEPALAFNIIYGAIEYAEDLGFSPHKDFRVTEYMLDDVSRIEYIDIPFGKDGKPFYIDGPNDNRERIINTLHKKLGEGNFNLMVSKSNDRLQLGYTGNVILFTEEQINNKLSGFGEESKQMMVLLFTIAGVVNELIVANQINIREEYDMVMEEIIEEVVSVIDSAQKTNPNDPSEIDDQFYEIIADRTEYLVQQYDTQNGFSFLLQPDFEPLPPKISAEELNQLPEEEKEKILQKRLDLLTAEAQFEFIHKSIAYAIIMKNTNDGTLPTISPSLKEEIIQEVLAEAIDDIDKTLDPEFHDIHIADIKKLVEELINGYQPV